MPANKPSLKARALRYLSAREHSRQELARKLARHAQEGDDINAVLDWLTAQKFLSEERFAESLAIDEQRVSVTRACFTS
jgi:regulatory protein